VVLLGGTLGVGWQAAKARRAAERAEQQARRAESEANRERVTKDFLISVFKASDPRIASDKPRGTITAKELLDISSDRIEQQFKSDPDAELELLGVAADIYGEFGETARSEKLLQRRVDLAQARDGELSPIVIGGLLQQTSNSNDRNEYAAALKQLDRIDALIKRAGLDRSAERARWWLLRSGALYADPNAEKEKAEALRKAVELFAEVAPNDRNYPQALADLGNVYFAAPDFPRAVDYNRRAIAALESQPSGDEGDLVQLYGNLAISLTYVGDFDGAERAYAHAAELAKRTYGDKHRFYWVVAARYAQTVHLRGERERASQMFEQLLPLIPARSGEFRNAYDEHEAAIVNETYGACLAADGRVGAAIPFLETAEYEYTKAEQYSYEIAHLRSILGLAYDRAGRTLDARRMLQAALDKYSSLFKPNHAGLLRQRQLWGSFLVRHDSLTEAEQQFREVLKLAADGNAFFVALAHGGLAQIAIKRRNVPDAEDSSRRAVELYDHVSGFRDVRMGPYLWRIRAEALFLSGDLQGARRWAERALDADRRYDDPSSGEIAEADETLRAVIAARNK
jgi:tetratricopeptide (TPR) repeat protein